MAVGDAYVFPGFLTPVLTQLFSQKPPTTFLTCFCRGERRKYAGKKIRLNRGSNSQPLGHESDTLTTEPPGRGSVHPEKVFENKFQNQVISLGKKDMLATFYLLIFFSVRPLFSELYLQMVRFEFNSFPNDKFTTLPN